MNTSTNYDTFLNSLTKRGLNPELAERVAKILTDVDGNRPRIKSEQGIMQHVALLLNLENRYN
jgi:hypothetical protein